MSYDKDQQDKQEQQIKLDHLLNEINELKSSHEQLKNKAAVDAAENEKLLNRLAEVEDKADSSKKITQELEYDEATRQEVERIRRNGYSYSKAYVYHPDEEEAKLIDLHEVSQYVADGWYENPGVVKELKKKKATSKVDTSGKDTQIKLLQEKLEAQQKLIDAQTQGLEMLDEIDANDVSDASDDSSSNGEQKRRGRPSNK